MNRGARVADRRKPRDGIGKSVSSAPDPASSSIRTEITSISARRSPRAYTVDLVLQRLYLLPCLEAPSDGAQVEGFDEERALIHTQQHLARDLLVPKHFTMLLFDTGCEEILGNIVRRPALDFFKRVSAFFFLVRLLALDIRKSMVDLRAVLAARITAMPMAYGAIGRFGPKIRDMLVNDVESIVQDLAVLARVEALYPTYTSGAWGRGFRREFGHWHRYA
jgi:hypothetical protein